MALSTGTRLGSYEITCVIGAGGMGLAFRVTETAFEAWEGRGGQSRTDARFPGPIERTSRRSFRPLPLRHDYRHRPRLARFFHCASVRKGAVIHDHLTEFCDSERVNNPFRSSRVDQ
jgi:hypothetical protein